MDEQRMWLLEIESTSGEAIVKTGEMATKNLERDINLVDRAMARSERTNADFEGGSTMGRTRPSDFTFPFHFHASEKETATHSSVLAWRIPGTGEPGGLPSMGLHRVRHN